MLCTLQDINMWTKGTALNLQFLLPNQLFFLKISVVCISYTLVTVRLAGSGMFWNPKIPDQRIKIKFPSSYLLCSSLDKFNNIARGRDLLVFSISRDFSNIATLS